MRRESAHVPRYARWLPWLAAAAVVTAIGTAVVADATTYLEGLALSAAALLLALAGSVAQRRTESALGGALQQLRHLELKAQRANRAKSEFLAVMSHELRTPLTTVISAADLLRGAELATTDRQLAETIETSAEVLLTLVDDILDFSRIEAGQVRLESVGFGLARVIEEVRRVLTQQAAASSLEFGVKIAPNLPSSLRGDPARLRQILLNLLGNAIKFTRRGRVDLKVSRGPSVAGRERIHFAVIDTGIGISAKDRERIFDTFEQADSSSARAFEGTGLGLAIVKQLVSQMGGEIGVDSERGQGSTFWLHLPLVAASEQEPVSLPAAEQRPLANPILVVDDHATNRGLALAHLQELGYRALGVASGREALQRGANEEFEAVLLDCQMPELDGYDTARGWRRAESAAGRRRVPIIAVTASARPGEREKCLAVGMDDYLVKPYRSAQLQTILLRWLGAGEATQDWASGVSSSSLTKPPVDRLAERLAALRRLSTRTGNDELGDAIAAFRQRSPHLLAILHQAGAEQDGGRLAAAAHELAGSAGMLGGAAVADLAIRIELDAPTQSAADLAPRVDQLEKLYEQFLDRLLAAISENPPS